jgi:hypothetical protein
MNFVLDACAVIALLTGEETAGAQENHESVKLRAPGTLEAPELSRL